MSDFFKSEMVRGDLQQIMELQKYCFQSASAFPVLSKEKKMEYFDVLQTLIEKQKIFNARLSLSDDPEAIDMMNSMKQAAVMLGANPDENINVMFDQLYNKVSEMRSKLEATGT
jgi:uncharacterized protein